MADAAGRFAAHLFSAAGRPARAAGWSVERVQEMLDAWVEQGWPHGALPTGAGYPQTPLERYEELTDRAGWIPTPLPPKEFRDLLDISWRVVGPSGLRLARRVYNSPALHPMTRVREPGSERRRIEVRWDPYDLRQVWLRSGTEEWLVVPTAAARQPLPTAEPTTRGAEKPSEAVPPSREHRDRAQELPEAARLAYHAQLRLHIPCVASAVDRIGDVRLLNQHAASPRYGVLLHGQPGTGKTSALLEAQRRCSAQSRHRLNAETNDDKAVPAVYTRLPPATSPRLLLVELARSFGLVVRGSPTTAEWAHRVATAMKDARTELILVDEAQHLSGPGWSDSAVVETVDYLCDRIPATFVFAGIGTPESFTSATAGARHRRLVPVRLSDVPLGESWRRLLTEAESALRLRAHQPGTLPELSGLLHERTGGNAGRLTFLLRSAAVRAIQDGSECLTPALLAGLPLPGSEAGAQQESAGQV
ncbi:AAA family ATPase [Streptomyces sp. NPDC002788]